VKVQRLTSTDGFIVWDLEAATSSVGVVRMAPKVLQDGAVLLARATTYAFAAFGVSHQAGASAAINSKPDQREAALAAFAEEVRPLAKAGQLTLMPGLGVEGADLAPLGGEAPEPALQAAGAIAAARVAGPLDWRRAAVVGSDAVAQATTEQLGEAGSTLVDGRYDAECDVLFVAGKAGCLDHDTAATVQASTVVPLTPVPVTARALAVLGKGGCTVIPDFLSTAASLLARHDPDGADPVQRIREATIGLAEAGTGMWLAAAKQAEEHLATWSSEKPFGRPLA
jgi:glutamate dehydrogenase/leucine dehydrogenase